MRRLSYCAAALMLAILLAAPLRTGVAMVTADTTITVPGIVWNVVIDGDYLVWEEYPSLVRAMRLPDGPVVDIGHSITNLQIDHGIVIWSEESGAGEDANLDVRGLNLATGEAYAIATSALDEIDPRIAGTVVIWTRASVGGLDADVVATDLATGQEYAIATSTARETRPLISGTQVVWQSEANQTAPILTRDVGADAPSTTLLTLPLTGPPDYGIYSIQLYDFHNWIMTMEIGAPTPVQVAIDDRYGGRLWGGRLAGNLIVYSRPPADTYGTFAWDTMTGVTTFLGYGQRYVIDGFSYFSAPATDGRYVVNGSLVPDTNGPGDLMLIDLQTGATITIASETDPYSQAFVDNDRVTWKTWDGASTTIHVTPLGALLPTAAEPDPGSDSQEGLYFPETQHALRGGFYDYWTGNGGLSVFGYPLTSEFREPSRDTGEQYTVQFTERQRFEWHPDNNPPYQVLLGRLGAELLTQQGRDWTTFPIADPSAPHFMPETGHAIAPQFWVYWSSHGLEFGDPGVSFRESLALFGYPLSEPMVETNADGDTVLTQYFERAVFEHHPDNPSEHQVLLRRLGAEALAARGW